MKHYYNFTFIEFSGVNGLNTLYGNVYLGFDEQLVTLPRIAEARAAANMGPQAIMIDCSYLGLMVHADFLEKR